MSPVADRATDGSPGDDYVLRIATDDDFDQIVTMTCGAFGWELDEGSKERERLQFQAHRDHVIVRGDQIVGNTGVYEADLTVPGAALPAALVTAVAVEPEHRRRGLLRRLMTHQLTEIHEAGRESVAILRASEGRIYQRFGYGLATKVMRMSIESGEVSLRVAPRCPGQLRTVPAGTFRPAIEQVYARVLPERPGWFTRGERWWTARFLDPEKVRDGATAMRVTVYERDGVVDGYLMWRMKPWFVRGGPSGEMKVLELVAATPEAYAALWHFALTMDLTRTVTTEYGAVDEPLVHMVDEPRRLNSTIADGLWLRIVDLPAALAGRRYAAPVDAIIEVSDALLTRNAGRWRLRAEADGVATCERAVGGDADLTCDIADLGAIYLGGVPLGRLVDAGRVRESRPGAVRRVAAAVGWHRDPAPFEMF